MLVRLPRGLPLQAVAFLYVLAFPHWDGKARAHDVSAAIIAEHHTDAPRRVCDAAGDNLRNTKIQISYFAKIRSANRNKEFRLSYFAARRNALKIRLFEYSFRDGAPSSCESI